ncbi:MAG: HAMP domain-containing histidine kinase, partial [Candidatus Mariimomonas ferrooxydans]
DEDNPQLIREYAHDIIKYSKEAANIVNDLSIYARIAKSKSISTINLNNVLDDALKMVRHSSAWGNIEVDKDYDKTPDIKANSVEIQQVFMNLINNAVQAMEGRNGRLSLSIRFLGDCIEIRVVDDGPGISKESREKIFEPFFTTKELGKGTGLGLSLVKEIVNKYNGSVRLESEDGKGATFIVNFPVQ